MSEKSLLLIGATGMIGGIVLRYALSETAIRAITSIGRRPTGLQDPKLLEIQHGDFTDFSSVESRLQGHDLAVFCLGAYTGSIPDAEFRKVTVDYTVALAEALYRASPGAAFCFLSGQGADSSEKSRVSFARYKGMAENALLSVGFPRVHVFRPGYIFPVETRAEPNVTYRVMRALYPAVRLVYPNVGISSEDLAQAMLQAGLYGTPDHDSQILENKDIRRFAAPWD